MFLREVSVKAVDPSNSKCFVWPIFFVNENDCPEDNNSANGYLQIHR